MELEEAIKRCEYIVQNFKDMRVNELPPHKFIINSEDSDCIETVLNYLEYYRVKVEKYKFMMSNDVIPKKKIEDKIKELQDIKTANGDIYVDVQLSIKILQELLENK